MYSCFADVERACAERGIGPARLFLENEVRLTGRSEKEIYDLMDARYGVRVDRARRQFEAADASPEDALLLDMEAGRAVCRVRTLAYCGQEPVEYSLARYRGDRNSFTVELYR